MRSGTVILFVELAVLVAMPLAAEIGLRAGRCRVADVDDALVSQVGVVQATAFAILGLLAAFAIAMAEERFDMRRRLVRDEANAIHATVLEAQYLPEPHRSALARLFLPYVEARIAYYDARDDVAAVERSIATAEHLSREMWEHAVVVVEQTPAYGDTNAVFVESLGEMIELQRTRLAALYDHVPFTITVLLVLVALFACGATGYACGLGKRRVWLAVGCLPLLVGIAICVVLDLDSPRVGLITSGQVPMLRLRAALEGEPR